MAGRVSGGLEDSGGFLGGGDIVARRPDREVGASPALLRDLSPGAP